MEVFPNEGKGAAVSLLCIHAIGQGLPLSKCKSSSTSCSLCTQTTKAPEMQGQPALAGAGYWE